MEEELKIADYLRQKTQSFLDLVDPLGPESFEDRPEIDEESAALLELKIDNLKLSLKQMIETLKLIERSIQELPTQYGQTGPLLWLTVVKVISTEKGNARDLETLGFVESTWPSIIEVALPRLFSRILEPKMDELIRVLRREQIFPRSQ